MKIMLLISMFFTAGLFGGGEPGPTSVFIAQPEGARGVIPGEAVVTTGTPGGTPTFIVVTQEPGGGTLAEPSVGTVVQPGQGRGTATQFGQGQP